MTSSNFIMSKVEFIIVLQVVRFFSAEKILGDPLPFWPRAEAYSSNCKVVTGQMFFDSIIKVFLFDGPHNQGQKLFAGTTKILGFL